MLDDLREKANDPDFFLDDEEDDISKNKIIYKEKPQLFLGMTPIQRFVIAVLILLTISVIGTFVLLVTEKIVLPFA
jgi:hypothetical protein